MWKSFFVKYDGIKLKATGLMTHELMNIIRTEMLQSEGITQRIATRLNGEFILAVTKI